VKEDERGKACSMKVGELLVGKPEGEIPLGRPRCRWVDDIEMDLGEIRWGGVV
jgi:hypothetical protein